MRKHRKFVMNRRRWMFVALAVSCVGLAMIIVMSSRPVTDKDRVRDLYYIQGIVDTSYQNSKADAVPTSLGNLGIGGIHARLHGFRGKVSDYTYTPDKAYDGSYDQQSYELCATFAADPPAGPQANNQADAVDFSSYHRGRTCFVIDAYQDILTAGKYNGGSGNYQGPH